MAPHLINQVRKEQTKLELCRLHKELLVWLEHRRKKDEQQQYTTQLNAIESLIGGAIKDMRPDLKALDLSASPGEFYEKCRLIDLRIVWLRRVWQFFREKFDQRDDKQIGPLLRAADEVIWSCYRQIFSTTEWLEPPVRQGPHPYPLLNLNTRQKPFLRNWCPVV